MEWFAQAPANIALIKYMGKLDQLNNIPDNPSLSYTLDHLMTSVMMESATTQQDFWEPLDIPGGLLFTLHQAEQVRFLKHLAFLKHYFNYSGGFIVRSSNNFPHSSGLASSASSFAALTKCAVQALCDLTNRSMLSIDEQARLSRMGSGSSCRSFFTPWAKWDGTLVESVELPYVKLIHQVVLITHEAKSISSSIAHQRVTTSPFYATRSHRARENLKLLMQALMQQDWLSAFNIVWREFHDMHQLFNTSAQAFSYMTLECQHLLNILQDLWHQRGDGPLITMDACPNIHLLYRVDQKVLAHQIKCDYLIGNYDVL